MNAETEMAGADGLGVEKTRLDRLRELVADEINRPHTDDAAELSDVLHNDDVLSLYVDGGDVPQFLACTSEGSGESTYRDNPDFFAGTWEEVGEWLAGSYNEGWACNWINDLETGSAVNWQTTVSLGDVSARAVLAEIARGIPKEDEWRSAADFMERTADNLDWGSVARPEHYEEG
jgi:hypothetical protein